MTFTIRSNIIQGKVKKTDEVGTHYYDEVVATGTSFEEILETAVVGQMDDSSTIYTEWVGDLPGELIDLVEADLRVEFNKAYQKALEASS